jgi:CHAT domain-containing protein
MRGFVVLTCLLLGLPAAMRGQPVPPDRPKGQPAAGPLTPAERLKLTERVRALFAEAGRHYKARRLPEMEQALRQGLDIYRRLYPGGSPKLARALNNLADLLHRQGRLAVAEPLCREALAMCQHLYPADKYPAGHLHLAYSLNNLAALLQDQGKLWEAETLFRQALAMKRRLFPEDQYPAGHAELAISLNNLAGVLQDEGRLAEAEPLCREALATCRHLYPADQYPAGHAGLALSLNSLASLLQARGRPAEAEPLFRDALAMNRRLYPESRQAAGHHELATSLNNLAGVLGQEGRPSAAEPLLREALAMYRRLYPPDRYPAGHPDLALGLNNLANLLRVRGRAKAAEPLCREALAMYRRLYPEDRYPAGHPHVAASLNSLALLLHGQGKLAKAEPLYREALAMCRRLYPEHKYPAGHLDLVRGLNNLALVLQDQGKPGAAEPLLRDALAMTRRVYPEDRFPGGHPHLAMSRDNLARLLHARGRLAAAEPLLGESLAIQRRLAEGYALSRSEGEALNFLAAQRLTLDAYLAITDRRGPDPSATYAAVWDAKAAVSRVFARRHLAARAATASPRARRLWDELSDLRRRRADLLLAAESKDAGTRQARARQLEAWADRINALLDELRDALPELARARDLRAKTPAHLLEALPPGTAFVDFVRYWRFTFDPARPGRQGEQATECYVVFVVTPKAVARVELGPAAPIEKNLALWRQAIEAGPGDPPADLPRALRRLLWDKVAGHLPAGVRTVYLAPDQGLAFLPWAALPGKQPGTVLLEDYALAAVPSGPFLLDRLTAPRQAGGPAGLLAVGAVAYDRAPAGALPAEAVARRGPAAGEGKPLTWKPLEGTAKEVERVGPLAKAAGVPSKTLTGAEPSAARLLAELPGCRYAHLATHGFFAGPEFRGRIRADEGLFLMSGRERVGAGALSPFLLSGLACAGANLKGTPGRGLLTAEALVNVDLSGMELAVLSACDTGLGEVGGGEGVLGLQRAFHTAGCKDVVASLWKVEDEPTAALMQLFYRNLWEKKQPPLVALRQAQLAVYLHPELVPGLARGDRAAFERVRLPAKAGRPRDGGPRRAPVRQWAAFVLSGAGR